MFERLFNEARPIDWLIVLIDLCVLLWIAAADIVKIPRWWKRRESIKEIARFLAEGEKLKGSWPAAGTSDAEANAWIESVKSWIVNVHSFLTKDALRAMAVFAHTTPGPQTETSVHPSAASWLSDLDARLSALRSILEKPENYF